MKRHIKRLVEKPLLAGIMSGIVTITYVGLITAAMFGMENILPGGQGPQYAVIFFMLVLFVLSAAICGVLVFGVPIYFLMQKEINKAGMYVAANLATFVFLLIVIGNLVLLAEALK